MGGSIEFLDNGEAVVAVDGQAIAGRISVGVARREMVDSRGGWDDSGKDKRPHQARACQIHCFAATKEFKPMSTVAATFASLTVAGDPGVNFGWTFSLSASVTVIGL